MISPGSEAEPALAGLRVVEVASDPAGEMAGQVLARYGADVIKVEPSTGSPTRAIGPFAAGEPGPESSLAFWLYNTGKRSVVADLPEARRQFDRLLGRADVLILSSSLAHQRRLGLDPVEVTGQFPELVVCAVTPFGQDGPWADYLNSDLVSLAAGGLLNSCGYDDHSIPPIRPAENQAFHVAASFALISILLALVDRQSTGRGQVIDLAVHDAVAVSPELANPYWFYPRALVQRQTCRHAQPSPTQPAIFRTLDDRYVYFTLILADPKPWRSLVAWMESEGVAADLTDPAYDDVAHRQAQFPHIQEVLEAFFLIQEAEVIYHEGQRRGLPVAVINAPEEVLADEHLQARGFFETVDHPDGRSATYPGPPIRFSAHPVVPPRSAPTLGSTRIEDIW
jgi:crotonobetainyl-CoA:carnitine CoA-transferase CaiB-like acyl-CoA transferase